MLRRRRRAAALLLTVLFLLGSVPAASAAEDMVTISAEADLLALAKNCSLDSWSRGRTVLLAADLELSDFTSIPTFGGVFDGQGHTISGLHLDGSGSSVGLFRTLQKGAVVRDLTVSGTVTPSGSASQAGGIVGINHGSVQNCVFQGTVQGENEVGGIAGLNWGDGEISGCRVSGKILGTSATGGIAGRNQGVLLKCTNSAEVNTISPDAAVFLPELEERMSEDNGILPSHSDTGGITGLSSGVIQSCVNDGIVGYPHVGYNVGGIAGRHSGYLSDCTNSGTVYGRKDVGGIVGQAEPDITLTPGAETLEQLQAELNGLNNLIDRSISSADAQGEQISQTLSALGGYTDSAKDHANTLLEQTEAFTDTNLEQLNTLSSVTTAALDRLTPSLDILGSTGDLVTDLCGSLREAVDGMEDAGTVTRDALDSASKALDRLESAGVSLTGAVDDLRTAAQRLQDAVVHHDPQAERKALAALAAALTKLGDGYLSAQAALSDLSDAVHSGIFDRDAIRQLLDAVSGMGSAAKQIAQSLAVLAQNTSFDFSSIEDSLLSLGSSLEALRDASRSFSAAMRILSGAADEANGLSAPAELVRNALRDALDTGNRIGSDLEQSFSGMADATDILRRDGNVSFNLLGDAFHDAGSGLYAAASGLSAELENLRNDMNDARGTLTGNLQAINRQTNIVMDLLLDAITEIRDGTPAGEIISDSSELETQEAGVMRQGKTALCVNTGTVEGDRNVGGIAGCMAIEYDLDPEEDLERFSLGSTYETRDILQENVNNGTITGKKDCAGGVAGRMDLGAVIDCESYGSVASTSGNFVGGIAGWSESSIRGCWAKCILSGQDGVGGIAGWSVKMRNCRAVATIKEGRSQTGAIAGDADMENGGIAGNCFVDTGTAGVDGVSYAGSAEPAAFAELAEEDGTPTAFTRFSLHLVADGQTTALIPFQYGEDLSRISLPEVPEREGFYGRWPPFDTTGLMSDITAEAVYTPWAALVASTETESENGPSLALAEGQFTEDAVLFVQECEQVPPSGGSTVWEIMLSGTDLPDDAKIPLRLLDRSGGGKVQRFMDGRWRTVSASVNGSYLLLEMDGLSGIYCVVPAQKNALIWLIPAAAVVVLLLLAAQYVKYRKKKQTSKAQKSSGSCP